MKIATTSIAGGCANKMSPKTLSKLLSSFPIINDKNLIVGFKNSDDACVYKLNDELALVQTLDFFQPMIDNPYIFGQIAATNALSDVYAMGGKPITAMNIVCFPKDEDEKILLEILKGGMEKLEEASVSLGGGHSIYDEKIKYGLSVTGTINPNKIWTNLGAKIGDILFYTKKIGTGIIVLANNYGLVSKEALDEAIVQMTTLNKYSYEIMSKFSINACTDITGFSILGHSVEMIGNDKDISFILDYEKIPKILNVEEYSKKGLVCGGGLRNIDFFKNSVSFSNLEEWQKNLLFDPQTSGGLLFSIPENEAYKIKQEFLEKNLPLYEVGKVSKREENLIMVR